MSDVVVVGAGPAGMMAAIEAAGAGARVTLLDRNEKLGKKLYITGKGRCNVTNAAERDSFFEQIPRNARFFFAAFSALDNAALMRRLEEWGVPLKVERGERVFPVSDHASDITRALERALYARGVKVCLRARVDRVLVFDGRVSGVSLETGETFPADRVILATGGMSYPTTGSTGDGYAFARDTGHAVTTPLPGLTSVETVEDWPWSLTGLTLKNVRLSARSGKKVIFDEQGELLFTHYGVSGPLALTMSSLLPEKCEGVKLAINLKPALDAQTLDKRVLREIAAAPNKRALSIVETLEPRALAAKLISLADVPSDLPANAITQSMRRALISVLQAAPLTVRCVRGFDEAIITRGGVSVKDVSPSTLESKRLPGLFFAGELLDLDAFTGGFNLQIAFSTGALAGRCAAR